MSNVSTMALPQMEKVGPEKMFGMLYGMQK